MKLWNQLIIKKKTKKNKKNEKIITQSKKNNTAVFELLHGIALCKFNVEPDGKHLASL